MIFPKVNRKKASYAFFVTGAILIAVSLISGFIPYLVRIRTPLPKFYIVQSGSMEPAIKTGSLVVSIRRKIYASGDVITFSKSNNAKDIVTHRVEARFFPDGISADPVYLTAGDANEDFDSGQVKHENVQGKIFLTIPLVGYLANFAKQPIGFILLVIVPATIIVYEEIRSLLLQLWLAVKKMKIRKKERVPLPKASLLIPSLGAFLLFVGLSSAYFFDIEESLGNILGAATSFGEKTAALYDSDPFTCPGGATDFSIPQPVSVIFKKTGGNIKVAVVLQGATPNSSYDIWINQDPGGCPLPAPTEAGAIITDANGDGTGDASISEVGGATNFWVSAVGGGQVLRSTSVSF